MEDRQRHTRRLFDILSEKLSEGDTKNRMVASVGASLRLAVGDDSCAVIDVRHAAGDAAVRKGDTKSEVDTSLELSDNAFALVCAGKLSPQHAFMTGRLVVRGDMLKAMRCGPLFELLRPPSILSGRQRASAPRDKTQADPGNNDRMDRSTNYLASPLARL